MTPKKKEEEMDRILILASDNSNEMMKRQVVNLKRIYPEAKIHRFEEGRRLQYSLLFL